MELLWYNIVSVDTHHLKNLKYGASENIDFKKSTEILFGFTVINSAFMRVVICVSVFGLLWFIAR